MASAPATMTGAMPDDGLPVVASRKPDRLGLATGLAIVAFLGLAVFWVLNAGREAENTANPVVAAVDPAQRISSPPPLAIPAEWQAADRREALVSPRQLTQPSAPPVRVVRVASPAASQSRPSVQAAPIVLPDPPISPRLPSVVFDSTFSNQGNVGAAPQPGSTDRVRAGRFENPSLTIPQGTVIPAVLETALDSTRPGGVRALVQRDVRGFDGSRVLIQRGSRLYGEYEADLQAGQKRASIRWTRLIRPDGVTIALDSPASDPLGRAGVKGDVDSKFFQRFGGALLQSVLDIGVGVETSKATDGVLVALPGSTQNVQIQDGGRIQPTLKVRHGTSVSVFVARDLDFSSVDR